jgi:hypothetical protein
MMSKYKFIPNCFVAWIIVLYIGSTVNALVGNICTTGMYSLFFLKKKKRKKTSKLIFSTVKIIFL